MTEVANKDLCAELYELSGWEGETHPLYGYEDDDGNRIPYYTLGYLLRKVGEGLGLSKVSVLHTLTIYVDDDTSYEDAAAHFAIQSFRFGELKKEPSND
jgi:hypothetical protein